jgi:hypothetical protein
MIKDSNAIGQPASQVNNLQAFWVNKKAQKELHAITKHLEEGGDLWLIDCDTKELSKEIVGTLSKLSHGVFFLMAESNTEDVCKEVAEQMSMLYMICDAITHVRSTGVVKGERPNATVSPENNPQS